MDPEGSTPELLTGDQTDHSQTNSSADIVDDSQPSQTDDIQRNDDVNESPSQTTDDSDASTAKSTGSSDSDDELAKWASSQNISLETETERKLAQRLRDTQRTMHQKAEAAKKFDKINNEVNTDDDFSRIETKLARMDFFDANPEARPLEGDMVSYVENLFAEGDEEAVKFFTSPRGWKPLYDIVKAQTLASGREAEIEAARTETKRNLAKAQQAGAPAAAAVNTAPTSGRIAGES